MDKPRIEVNKKKNTFWVRLFFTIFYMGLGAGILLYFIWKNTLFYSVPDKQYDIPRVFWCIAFSFIGFGILLLQILVLGRYRDDKKNPALEFIFYNTPMLVIVSVLVFSVLHIFAQTKGQVFYYLSSSICTFSAFINDYVARLLIDFVSKSK